MGRADTAVLTDVENAEILDPVIPRIAVDVINLLVRQQLPTEMLFHDVPVFMLPDAIDAGPFVGTPCIRPLGGCVAGLRAEALGLHATRRQVKDGTALGTFSRGASGIVSFLSPERRKPRFLNSGNPGLGQTRTRTETGGVHTVSGDVKPVATYLATDVASIPLHVDMVASQRQAIAIAMRVAGKPKPKK